MRSDHSNDLVTVATYSTLIDADLAKTRLEAGGLFVHLAGDVFAGTTGGVRLLVREEDRERALSILRETS